MDTPQQMALPPISTRQSPYLPMPAHPLPSSHRASSFRVSAWLCGWLCLFGLLGLACGAQAQPAAAPLPGAPRITAILPGSTYQCRARVGGASDKLSEHALGNAFDVAGLRFSNGEEMLIAPRGDSGGIEEAFQKAIRYGACLYFTTVLGPGSNAAHDDHLHFDGAVRKGGWRLCE